MQTAETRKEGEVFWTVSDVRKNIESGRMAAWNKDRDILITPYSNDHHFVFVDDTKPDALKKAGYTPCLVQESSKDNYQAVLKVPKSKDDTELVAINRLCLNINRRLGDAGAGYADHSFRLAGFANRKPGRDGHFTQIDMRESQFNKPCKTATAELDDWRNAIREEREDPDRQFAYVAEKRIGRDLARIEATAPDADCRIVAGALNRWTGLLKKNGPIDHSVVDYKVAEELLVKGWDKDRIATALHAMSPDLQDRKGKWSPDYISRTIDKAMPSAKQKIDQDERYRRLCGAYDKKPEAPKVVPGLSDKPKPEEPKVRRSYGPSM